MTFKEIALTPAKFGIPVFPLRARTKNPATGMTGWPQLCTVDPAKIETWNALDPTCNVACVAKATVGGTCFLEWDVKNGPRDMAREMGEKIPRTMTNASGKGFTHLYFKHTARSIALGNRNGKNPDGGEWFSFRADDRYVVGAGSIHPNGNEYVARVVTEPIEIPDWVCTWIENHSAAQAPLNTKANSHTLDEDFDIDDFVAHVCEAFGASLYGETTKSDGVSYYPLDICPNIDDGHATDTHAKTCITFGDTLGFHCFGGSCIDGGFTIGHLLRKLREIGEPWEGRIWAEREDGDDITEVDDGIEDPEMGTPLTMDEVKEMFSDTPPVKREPVYDGSGYKTKEHEIPQCDEDMLKPGETLEEYRSELAKAKKLAADEDAADDAAIALEAECEAMPEKMETVYATEGGLKYPELVFPFDECCTVGSKMRELVDAATEGRDGKYHVLDPGFMFDVILTLASGQPSIDVMIGTRISRFVVLLAMSRAGKDVSWTFGAIAMGLTDGTHFQRTNPVGHSQMIQKLGDSKPPKSKTDPNPQTIPGPRKMVWITSELSAVVKSAKSEGSRILEQFNEFYDNSVFETRDRNTGRLVKMNCRLSWGSSLAIGRDEIEERKFTAVFGDVTNDGFAARLCYGFSETAVDSRDLEERIPHIEHRETNIEPDGEVEEYIPYVGRLARHLVRGYEDGVKEKYYAFDPGELAFPAFAYVLKKTMLNIAIVNLHENVTMDDFDAAAAYILWQGRLRKVFRTSDADDNAQAQAQELIMRNLWNEDKKMGGRNADGEFITPLQERWLDVRLISHNLKWEDRYIPKGIENTIIELCKLGSIHLKPKSNKKGKEIKKNDESVLDWKRVRVYHTMGKCKCGIEHKRGDFKALGGKS